mmetsp:Transcript_132268/g.411148  ORF Transcript_132268/g.411148 Transcript_132268/m.411148 type:complete len:332 (-) Transcript_132268:77-1072(-)
MAVAALPEGHLDVRRMTCISLGMPSDHTKDVMVVADSSFDIESTIFKTMDIPKVKSKMAEDMGKKIYWDDSAVAKAMALYTKVPPPMPHDRSLVDFIREECEFNVEHADGSFMDHLKFCYDYSATHFAGHSPRALFLHSILGTGTNVFPMELQKLDKLSALLDPEEMAHVQAFPSILRLLHTFTLQKALMDKQGQWDQLKSISFHRVIDNERVSITAEQLWVQLNYQLIHELDFLPLTNWSETVSSGSFQSLRSVHQLLSGAGKLEAYVNLDVSCHGSDGKTVTLREAIAARPAAVEAKERQGMAWFHSYFSNKIGHSLAFDLEFAEHSRL